MNAASLPNLLINALCDFYSPVIVFKLAGDLKKGDPNCALSIHGKLSYSHVQYKIPRAVVYSM